MDEVVTKSGQMPRDIRWHFIGHLQSNKAKSICAIPNLYAIHTIDSVKLADKVNKGVRNVERQERLRVFIQIKTSSEESKHGVDVADRPAIDGLVTFIREETELQLVGLMTIGQIGDMTAFSQLRQLRDSLTTDHGLELELSMGMSGDFEMAIQQGSNNVRVGSSIFGARQYK